MQSRSIKVSWCLIIAFCGTRIAVTIKAGRIIGVFLHNLQKFSKAQWNVCTTTVMIRDCCRICVADHLNVAFLLLDSRYLYRSNLLMTDLFSGYLLTTFEKCYQFLPWSIQLLKLLSKFPSSLARSSLLGCDVYSCCLDGLRSSVSFNLRQFSFHPLKLLLLQ